MPVFGRRASNGCVANIAERHTKLHGPGRGLLISLWNVSPDAIADVRMLARALAPSSPEENFRREPAEEMSFGDASFDAVLSSAVLISPATRPTGGR